MLINVPPIPEQQKIAEILETWDQAIETVEALIANSQAQKKALMQKLLTGKRRLPGFSGEWKLCELQDVAAILVSNVDKKSDSEEKPVRLCNYMDVYSNDEISSDMRFMEATASEPQILKFRLQVDDVLITKDSETPDDIAVPSYVAASAPDLVCGYHLAIIRPKKGTDGRFLKFYFENPLTQNYFASRANGATRFGLTINSIETAPISLPTLDEQQLIGQILAKSEQEERLMKGYLGQLKQEKDALMQQLLTGKRRVKVSVEAARNKEVIHA